MALASGSYLGPYEIRAAIGAGGMGEVYAATDTRLGRTVAIKVLPAELAADPDRRERFEREVKAIAALNHPHICTLYDVGRDVPSGDPASSSVDFLVMERLEGETLADRLTHRARAADSGAIRALALDEALQIGIQVAEALDEAHRHGITHRDLKPTNIFLVGSGGGRYAAPLAKLLDFGLAKLARTDRSMMTADRTRIAREPLTAPGSVLGTIHYMAPELFEGQEANACSDIWAFGCVLFEMLTGEKLFDGGSAIEIVAAIARHDPTWERVPDWMPAGVRRALSRSVRRDPGQRLQHIADVKLELLEAREALAQPTAPVASRGSETTDVVRETWTLSVEVCRAIDRDQLDPSIIGGHIEYFDNQRPSSHLVVYLPPIGFDASTFEPVLRRSPYRGIAVTPFGMEPGRTTRVPLRLGAHLALLRQCVDHLSERLRTSTTIVVGYSSAADLALRLVAEGGAAAPRVAGVLALGPNIDLSSAFYCRELAAIPDDAPAEVFRVARDIMGRMETAENWLRLNPYFEGMVRKYRHDVGPLRLLARDILEPLTAGTKHPIAEWYRSLKDDGVAVRVLMSSAEDEQAPLRRLMLAHLDDGILGPLFEESDFPTLPASDHFDLIDPGVVEHHLADLFDAIHAATCNSSSPSGR